MTTEGSENIIESEEERVQSDLSGEEAADQAIRGLTLQEVEDRKARGLINEEVSSSTRTIKEIVKENVLTYFNLIFAVLAVLLIAVGQFKDLTFLLIVAANTGIGIAQEIRSKQILDNLKFEKMPRVSAVRDGKIVEIPTEELVQDDVVILSAGAGIPADAVIVSGSVQVNEALVTGESDEINKGEGEELLSGSFIISAAAADPFPEISGMKDPA